MEHEDRAPLGLLVAALAAAILAVSVFMPWYGVSITPSGSSVAQAELAVVAQKYGNATFQTQVARVKAEFGSITGHELVEVSAHDALSRESLILLVLAGSALLASLLRLAGMRGLLFATGSQIALLGGLAFAVVFFRLLVHPGAGVGLIAYSPGWGIWLSLASAAAIACGGLAASSDRISSRASAKRGPGPPTLGTPPTVHELSQTWPSPPTKRRR